MARKLKVYQTSQGFYDLAVAAPTMKAALEAWGAGSNLFQQGDAKLSDDRTAISAAMKQPGVVLRRPIETQEAFTNEARAPRLASLEAAMPKAGAPKPNVKRIQGERRSRNVAPAADGKAERRAASEFEKERARQEKERAAIERAQAKAAERRKLAIEQAERALGEAQRKHDEHLARISESRAAIDQEEDSENLRWDSIRKRLMDALQKARS